MYSVMDVGDSKQRSHEQLHFNAPLLSTRRFGTSILPPLKTKCDTDAEHDNSSDTSRRVPFLWERVPGTPKVLDRQGLDDDELPPPPKLPPSRWHPPKEGESGRVHNYNDNEVNFDDGRGDNDDDDDKEVYCDAMDAVSFFESFGIQDSTSGVSGLEGLDSKAVQSRGNLPPNFIMDRFLPAASALASSSTSKNLNKKVPPHRHRPKKEVSKRSPYQSTPKKRCVDFVSHSRTRPYSPPKSGGLLFFPWHLKHTLCGLKSPVRSCSDSVKHSNNSSDKDTGRKHVLGMSANESYVESVEGDLEIYKRLGSLHLTG